MTRYSWAIAVVVMVLGCDSPTEEPPGAPQLSLQGVQVAATGGGHYELQGAFDVTFSFSALQRGNGNAAGRFHIAFSDADAGFEYSFHGRVTCLSSDPANGRAWIGGVVTSNSTTDPAFLTSIHQVGKDVWFRVLDSGEGQGAVDRISFYGFEGGGGIITSAQYCADQIWPADNARTWPVTSGNISVH